MLTSFFAIVMPLIALLILCVINVSHVVYAKIRLQDATDRAAYAGAAKQSYIMNRMGDLNLEIQKKYANLKEELQNTSKQSMPEGRRRVSDVRREINALWATMENWNDDAWQSVADVSRSILAKSYGGAELNPPPRARLLTLIDRAEPGQYQRVRFDGMTGDVFFDPKDHDHGEDRILSYLLKDPTHEVRWEIQVCAKMPALFLQHVLDKAAPLSPKMCAVSAAQPHGGNIRTGDDYLVSFVPVRRPHAQ